MTSKLRNFLDRVRLERRARRTVAKAQAEQDRLRRLTPDGLDPEDPSDHLFIEIRKDLMKERDRLRELERKAQIKQIAYRLMEKSLSGMTLNPNSEQQKAQLSCMSTDAYREATVIFDLIELAAAKENL